jgi:hypothetical protein
MVDSTVFQIITAFSNETLQAQGTAQPSFLASQLEAFENDGSHMGNTLVDIQGAAGGVHSAGQESVSHISSFDDD